ncbi:curli assembly chaperone CsgC [Kosakonia pseudosacchari]|uniref:curli assembly chaperone CsgC n=1 Tax=Kosakonia pseudosacchari TaxID=1646340 RepID=UPI000A38FBED|nr:curli assembly chaperone CsgC [Kosakonia pseudosacchari]
MHTLLLLAALSSQITFDTTRDGDNYTITPLVQVTQDCVCQVQIITEREGAAGVSQSRQRNTMTLPANQTTALSRIRLNISPHDNVKIIVTVSDGQSLHLAQQWPAE